MPQGADPRLADWIDLVGQLLTAPPGAAFHDQVAAQLGRSFEAGVVAWSESLVPSRHRMWPPELMARLPVGRWLAEGLRTRHPLLRWYATTGDPRAQTIRRVPALVSDPREADRWRDETRPFGVEQELSLPVYLRGADHRAFVVSRAGDDFCAADLQLARQLQPVLAGLDRQAAVLSGVGPAAPDSTLTSGSWPSWHCSPTASPRP